MSLSNSSSDTKEGISNTESTSKEINNRSTSAKPQNSTDNPTSEVDIKELAFKRFLYMEASFRYQEVSPARHLEFPRSTTDKLLTIGTILQTLCPDVLAKFTGKVILNKRLDNSVVTDLIEDSATFLAHSPFAYLFHANGDGTSTVYDESVNLSLEYKGVDEKKYFTSIIIKPLGSTENSVYARLSVMTPHEGVDDLFTLRSKSLPMAASCIIVYDVMDPQEDLKRYEVLEKKAIQKANEHAELDPFEDELMRGISGINYPRYNMAFGKWLLDQERYYDAYVTFERAYNCLKIQLSHLDKEGQAAFYRASYAMGLCLQKLGFLDKASYFFQLAINGGQEYIAPYVEALAESSHNRVCLFLNQLRRQASTDKSAEEELRRLEQVVAIAENNYKVPETINFAELPLGYVLRHLFDVEPRCLLGASVWPMDHSEGKILSSSDDIYNLNMYDLKDTLVYVRYTRAGWEMKNEVDKSILCQNNCIVFNIHSVVSENGKTYVRVNTMLPNFTLNDEKRIPGPFNLPKGASFIIGADLIDRNFSNQDLEDIFHTAMDLRADSRVWEAMRAFEFIHNVLKIEYTKVSATDETEELFFEATHQLGYCLMDLGLFERATYYLDWAQEGYKADYAREYVNCLCNNNDIRALDVIENLMVNMQQPNEPEYQESFQYFQSFLRRRKAYVLLNRGDVQEAENYLKELLADPLSKDYAEHELDFIKNMKK